MFAKQHLKPNARVYSKELFFSACVGASLFHPSAVYEPIGRKYSCFVLVCLHVRWGCTQKHCSIALLEVFTPLASFEYLHKHNPSGITFFYKAYSIISVITHLASTEHMSPYAGCSQSAVSLNSNDRSSVLCLSE